MLKVGEMSHRHEAIRDLREAIEASWQGVNRENFHEIYRQASIDEARIVKMLRAELELSQSEQLDISTKYFSNVIAVGYAGYFATWFLVNAKLSEYQSLFIAFAGFLSLSLFMLWEVFQMLLRMIEYRTRSHAFVNLLQYSDIDDRLNAFHQTDGMFNALRFRVWVITFVLTVISALAGAVTMLVGIGEGLFP